MLKKKNMSNKNNQRNCLNIKEKGILETVTNTNDTAKAKAAEAISLSKVIETIKMPREIIFIRISQQ